MMTLKMRLALWGGLVVVFVVLYQLTWSGGHSGAVSTPARWATPWFFFALWAVLFLSFLSFFLWRARKANTFLTTGVTQLSQGRYLEAARSFQEAAKRFPRSPGPVFNLGVAQVALWRVEDAEASFAKANRMSMRMMNLRPLIAPYRAFGAAFLGRSSDAEARLSECERLGVDSNAMATLARGVLAARAARWTDAHALLSRIEMNALGGPSRGLADALRAWTIQQLSGELRHVDRVAIFGESGPDVLKEAWPELHEFIQRAPAA